jgi:hypothetical protein
MCRNLGQTVNINRPPLVIACIALVALTAASQAQPGLNRQAENVSPRHSLTEPQLETRAPNRIEAAPSALAMDAELEPSAAGGLWVSGDTAEGLRYLRWIAGEETAGLLKIGRGGKVAFTPRTLAKAAGASENRSNRGESSPSTGQMDEGRRLLEDLTGGTYRFLLYIGEKMPTRAGRIKILGTSVLDSRFDSRVNTLRRNGQKLDQERPPKGFDSLVAINPNAYWFNLYNQQFMPKGQLTFHELAEAHARVALGYDYLPQGDTPGAHDTAIEREYRLKQGRPGQVILVPAGINLPNLPASAVRSVSLVNREEFCS